MVNKVTWQKAGRVTEPGRYMFRYGWLTVTAEDLADLAAISRRGIHARQDAVGAGQPRRSFTSAHSSCRPTPARASDVSELRVNSRLNLRPTPRPAGRLPTASHRRRAEAARAAGARWLCLVIACDRRRPRTVDPCGLDRIDDKPVAASPQRHRAVPAQALAIDHRGRAGLRRLPRGHDQGGAVAIVRQRLGALRQRHEARRRRSASRSRCRRRRRLR